MKPKLIFLLVLGLIAAVAAGWIFRGLTGDPATGSNRSSTSAGGRKVLYWQAPMDPSYIRDEPGKSPMGMDLRPVYADDVDNSSLIAVDPVITQNMGIRTAVVTEGPLVRDIRTTAHLAIDEELLYTVTNKFDGWIEKLYVDKTGQDVKAGERLFEIYSPELVQAQVSYLESLSDPRLAPGLAVRPEERARAESLLESTSRRFLNWDVPSHWLDQLKKDRQPQRTVPIDALASGVVLHKSAVEGTFFKAGSELYRIADLSRLWAIASIYESERSFVVEGQPATMTLSYMPGRVYKGHVDYVYPYVNPKTRDISIRLVFPNEARALLPDMYADVTLRGRVRDNAVLVPASAVIDTGRRQIVFVVREEGKFEGRDVHLGILGEGDVREVLHGLEPGEIVVVSGQFLLDSESRIREAIKKFAEPTASHDGHQVNHEHISDPDDLPQLAPSEGPRAGVPPAAKQVGDLIYLNNDTCPVEGGPVEEGYAVVWDGIRVELCCPGCDKKFLKEPRVYLQRISVDPDKVKAAFLKGAPIPIPESHSDHESHGRDEDR